MGSPTGDWSASGDLAPCGPPSAFTGDPKMNRNELLAIKEDSHARLFSCASRSNWIRHRVATLAVFLMLACLPSARAQVSASIKGIVTDPSGAQVPSATVIAKNTETGASRSAITDASGRYQFV